MRQLWFAGSLAVLVALSIISPSPVAADGGGNGTRTDFGENKDHASFTATITTNDRGIWIDIHGQQSSPPETPAASTAPVPVSAPSAPPPPPANAQPAGPTIVRSWYDPAWGYYSQTSDGHVNNLTGLNISSDAEQPGGWFQVGEQQHPNTVPMAFTVDGQLQNIVWVPEQARPNNVNWGPPQMAPPNTVINGGGTDPHGVALDLLAHIPLPNIELQENPGLGLVSVPGWFWIANYDGAPFGASRTVTLPPAVPGGPPTSFTVTVRVWPVEYDWLFGDGGSLTSQSLGEAYPAESDVQHTYEYSSFRFPDGFPVHLTVHFKASFQVNGGAPQPLPPILHTYAGAYPVQEAQSILETPRSPHS